MILVPKQNIFESKQDGIEIYVSNIEDNATAFIKHTDDSINALRIVHIAKDSEREQDFDYKDMYDTYDVSGEFETDKGKLDIYFKYVRV
jgi:hypothetical protein